MLRLIFTICLIIISAAGSYYLLIHEPDGNVQTRPEISSVKKDVIAKRAEQKINASLQDEKDRENVRSLEKNVK